MGMLTYPHRQDIRHQVVWVTELIIEKSRVLSSHANLRDSRPDAPLRHHAQPVQADNPHACHYPPGLRAARLYPRTARKEWPRSRWEQAQAVLEFVQSRGVVHPREVTRRF